MFVFCDAFEYSGVKSLSQKQEVAVLLAAYNGMEFIEVQIESIMAQKNVHVHIYISVDLSFDGTYEYCKAVEKKDARITVLDYGERFGGAAKNFYRLIKDVDISNYAYVSFADQDDIWLENKLIRAVRCLKEKGCDGYSSDVIAFWDNGQQKYIKKSFPQTDYDYFFESAGPGCTYVLTARTFQEFKGFVIHNASDVHKVELHDWMIYAFYRAKRVGWYIDDWPSMLYRQHATNQFGSNSGVSPFLKRVMMIKNHWYRAEVEKIYDLVGMKSDVFSLNNMFLLNNFYKLRRRWRDKFVLAFFLMVRIF